MAVKRYGVQHHTLEWAYTSGHRYSDPFNQVELDVVISDALGHSWRVPCYWAGEQEWRVRFAAPGAGMYTCRSECSDVANPDLHGQESALEIEPYRGNHPLYRHGPLRVSQDRRYLEHLDGAPFFWLGDTWWMSLCKRLSWPDEFQTLAADRVAKGFSVIQIVAGLYPDMPAYDERGFNEAGHPWEPEYARINPAYFDMADLRIQWLAHVGLTPCIVACWGYHLPWLGLDKMKQHWRNLVARYGAYPVIWCLAGEGTMPYYLSKTKEADKAVLRRDWTEMARYLRQIDPYHRPITIHPDRYAHEQVTDPAVLDFDMLQTGHSGYESLASTVESIRHAVAHEPTMPVIEGEANYEGIMGSCYEDGQLITYWAAILSGAKGFTYGANGIWQVNTVGKPYGPSPHGGTWGNTPWNEAYQLPGSRYLSIAKRLLEHYPWQQFENHQEWVQPHAEAGDYLAPYAAGGASKVRVYYFPKPIAPWGKPVFLTELGRGMSWRAFFFDPRSGARYDLGVIQDQESWPVPGAPEMHDWVLVLERAC